MYKVQVTFKDGVVYIETFEYVHHMKAYIEYIKIHLKDFIKNVEILKDDQDSRKL